MDGKLIPVPGCLMKLASGVLAAAVLAGITGCTSGVERYRELGMAQYDKGQYDESLQSLNKALSYDQFDAKSNAYAGLIHYRAQEYVQAAYHFKLALQADPSSDEAKDGLVATYIKLGEPDTALDALERAAKVADTVRDPREKKMVIARRYQSGVEERLYLGKADDRLRIGRAYEKLGDYDNALAYYNKALQYVPEHPVVLLAMANLAERAKNPSATREYLARAYRSDPATPGLTDALTRNGMAISEIVGAGPSRQP